MSARFTPFPTIDPRLSPVEQQRIWVREAEKAKSRLMERELALAREVDNMLAASPHLAATARGLALLNELESVRQSHQQAREFVLEAREALRRYEGDEQPVLSGSRRALVREVK